MHSLIGRICEMDFEWEWSNMPVWLDSLQLFFFTTSIQHYLTVFHNFKTPLLWLPKIQRGCRAQQPFLLRICLRDDPFSAPRTGVVALSPADGM